MARSTRKTRNSTNRLERKGMSCQSLFPATSVYSMVLCLSMQVYPSSSFLINKQCGIINERHPGPMAMSMSVPKNDFYHDFKNSIAESFALSPSKIKLWSLITRCNKTFRVDRCIEDVANSNTSK